MIVRVITPPEPVITLERAKLHCKIDGDERDDELNDAIETARAAAQNFLERAVGEQELEVEVEGWGSCLQLPFLPTVISSVTLDGVAAAEEDYTLYGKELRITGESPLVVTFTTGWAAADVPGPVKSAMLLMIADLMRNQQAQTEVQLYRNEAVDRLLWPYRDCLGV
jgi:hypothetical protein